VLGFISAFRDRLAVYTDIFLPVFHVHMLSQYFDILKKHVNLSTLSQNHVCALCNCSGWTLGHVEGVISTTILLFPKNLAQLMTCSLINILPRFKPQTS